MAADLGGGEPANASVSNIFKQPNLLVNRVGKRIMNEEYIQNSTYLSNLANHQKDKVVFNIVDTSIIKYYIKHGVDVTSLVANVSDVSDFFEGFESLMENGSHNFFRADTIEELAEKAGIDVENLKETIDDYNFFCDSVDEEFFKAKRYLRPIFKAPFYAAAHHPGTAKLYTSFPYSSPVYSLIISVFAPAPPVQIMAASQRTSISSLFWPLARTPTTLPSSLRICVAAVSRSTVTPSSNALLYKALFIKEAALGPIPLSVFTICQVASDCGK